MTPWHYRHLAFAVPRTNSKEIKGICFLRCFEQDCRMTKIRHAKAGDVPAGEAVIKAQG